MKKTPKTMKGMPKGMPMKMMAKGGKVKKK